MSTRTYRRPRTGLLVLAAALALVLIGSLVIGHLDADALRPRIEAAFRHATGRTLRIDGSLRLTLLPVPGFVASDIAVSNLAGGSQPTMLSARSVRASIDPLALFDRRIHIDSLVLDRPDLLLETVQGEPNWRFAPERAAAGPGAPTLEHRPSFAWRISAIDATKGQVAWHDLPRLGSGMLALDVVHAQQQGGGDALTIYAEAHHGNARLTASVATGAAILNGSAKVPPIPMRATFTLGDEHANRLHVDGTVAEAGSDTRFSGSLQGALGQLSDLNALFPHAALPTASDLRLDAHIRQDDAGRWQLLSGAVSASQADLARLFPGLTATRLTIDVPAPDRPAAIDAAGFLASDPFTIKGLAGTAAFWTEQTTTTPFDLTAILGPDRLSLSGALSRSGPTIDGLDGAGRLALPDPSSLGALIHTPHLPPLEIAGHLRASRDAAGKLTATLAASTVAIKDTNWPASTLTLTANRQADPLQATASVQNVSTPWLIWSEQARHVTITLDAHALPAGPLAILATGQPSITGRLDVSGRLQAVATRTGIDEQTLTGPITARIVDADIDASVIRSAVGDVLRVAHLPRLPGASGHVGCAEAAGAFQDGALHLNHLSANASLISVTGSGTIDIPHQSLDLHLKPLLRLGGTGLATAVTLAGPIVAPTASLQASANGRVGFEIGRAEPVDTGACNDTTPGAPPRHKAPKPADILRSLGLIR